ncbi:MAG: Gfo/Idh/MocA family oxidoreductase [Candidatus Krumholzibacteriota bacterium]|nr:Gfo/Idh/MocA family oxidoreductase [Candidatus Krumholzibacteriota bacterium]
MDRPLGIGIVGTGIHGARYALHLREDVPGLALAAISRRSPAGAEQARDWGCRWHADWQDLVADEGVAAVVAAATPDLNPAIAAACAAAGKSLLVEKPLAVDPVAGEAMLAAFDGAPASLTIAQTLRYNRVILALREALPRAGRLHAFAANQRLERSAHSWLEDPAVAGGGVILHTAVHLFDALRFITGREVVRVRAWTARRYNTRLEDLFVGLVELSGGALGTVDAGKVSPARQGRYEFAGDAGQLQGDQIHGALSFVRGAERESLPVAPLAPTLPPLLADWERHLRGRGPSPIPAAEGLAALRVCEACARSAREGREVAL